MTIKNLLQNAIDKLTKNQIESSVSKARSLLAFVLGESKEYLIVNENENIEENRYNDLIGRLANGEPLQHITGTQEFMKLNFLVNKNVLIPRPDTEILVEEIINNIKILNAVGVAAHSDPGTCGQVPLHIPIKILDLCTGSGAIAISLAKYLQNTEITATDISEEALDVAKQNAEINDATKIQFIKSNLFERITQKFDIIVSNPPYIETDTINNLDKEIQYEPKLALDGGKDGLDFYRKIIKEAHKFLNPNGHLCLEIGYNQKEKVIELIEKENKYTNIYSKKDLEGNDRIVICQLI